MGDKQKERIAAKNGLESYCFNMKTTKLKIKFLTLTRRPSVTNATRQSNGWMPISLPRSKNSMISRRKLREFATPSSLSCTSKEVACLKEGCQAVCQEVVCQVLEELEVLEVPPDLELDLP